MSATQPMIDAATLQARLAAGEPLQLLDVHFDLVDATAGERGFAERHLPGAAYLHLDHVLSSAKTGLNGRHPLPGRELLAQRLSSLGLRDDAPVVVYDSAGGMFAARAWWMLRWLGLDRVTGVQVLDGGLPAWVAAGGALQSGAAAPWPARDAFRLREPSVGLVGYAALRAGLGQPGRQIVDARAADRFRGENETLDPVGGHIPGALNRPFKDNLAADGRFKPLDILRTEWQALMAGRSPDQLVMQCGSGVTACHHLLALAALGLDGATLYAGSWSEWCAQPDAVIATGA
ncbi:MAG: sulfurtransferase [Burkholderiaceae bacterium]|nr:sulfurtransferase [Burkholderiaceae bacterium]